MKKNPAFNGLTDSVTTLFTKNYKCFGAWSIFEVLDFMLKQNLQVLEKKAEALLIVLVLEALNSVLELMPASSLMNLLA